MRCICCNKPFYATLTYKYNKPVFAKTCSYCNSAYHQGYVNSHEHVLGINEEPLVIIAKSGSIKMEVTR